MKIIDANVLLYAVNEDAPHHKVAKNWLDTAFRGSDTIGFAWVVLLAFLRLSTRAGLFPRPLALDDAVRTIETWLARPTAVILSATPRHLNLLHGLLAPLGAAGNLVNDAHLATLALEHGAEVISFDPDFARFPGLRWQAPGPS